MNNLLLVGYILKLFLILHLRKKEKSPEKEESKEKVIKKWL